MNLLSFILTIFIAVLLFSIIWDNYKLLKNQRDLEKKYRKLERDIEKVFQSKDWLGYLNDELKNHQVKIMDLNDKLNMTIADCTDRHNQSPGRNSLNINDLVYYKKE